MRTGAPPDAVFFAGDIMAFGGMDAFRGKGLDIPRDISVAGFNNVPLAGWPPYAPTTISHPHEEMAEAVIGVLGFDGRPAVQNTAVQLVRGVLVRRGSTGPSAAPLASVRA